MSKGRVAASVPYRPYLLADLRADPQAAADYLNEAAKDEHPGLFLMALRDVIDAYGGIGAVAKRAGLNRPQLYRTLTNGGNPEYHSLLAILEATGFSMMVVPRLRRGKKPAAGLRRGKNFMRSRHPAQVEAP